MEPLLIHLLKSTALGLLFLVSYLVFLRKETFYATNRFYLILGLVVSVVLPFIEFTKTIWIEQEPITYGDFTLIKPEVTTAVGEPFNWNSLLLTLYLMGVSFFAIRLLMQLYSIKQLKRKSDIVVEKDIKHVRSKKQLSPFSFFKHIFYCPTLYNQEELTAIITHEKVHVRQHHSADALFMQVVCLLLWFNPLVWMYKHYVKQNLEFLADSAALHQISDKKQYQYLMLKQAVGGRQFSITNPFFNTLIKKRIVMLNQKQSKKSKLFKLLILLPILGVFLVGFNTKTVYKTVENPKSVIEKNDNSFRLIITENTTNSELERVKSNLKAKGMDFSYTTVRNDRGEIIDIQFDINGKVSDTKLINGNYQTKNTRGTIADILIKFDETENEFYIGEKEKETFGVSEKNAIIAEYKVTNVTIDVDKNSSKENLEKDSKFLAKKGVKVDFKSIKKNKRGEITSIKVNYDDGFGNKGNYSQKKTTTITPFKIIVDFNKNKNPNITIKTSDGAEIPMEKPLVEGTIKNTVEETKIVKINMNDSIRKITLNGKEISVKELEREGKMEKSLSNIIQRADSVDGFTIVSNLSVKHQNGNEERADLIDVNSDSTQLKYLVSKKYNVPINQNNSNDSIAFQNHSKNSFGDIATTLFENKDPLIIIDGKEATFSEANDLKPEDILTINVFNEENIQSKYGEKAKNGVVKIVTKKKN